MTSLPHRYTANTGREDRNKHYNRRYFSGQPVDQIKCLSGKVDLHSLSDDRREMSCLVILLAPFAIKLAELPILVSLLSLSCAQLTVTIPAYLHGHVLLLVHEFHNFLIVRILVTFIPASFAGHFAVHFHGDPGIGNSGRERVIQIFIFLECLEKFKNTRLTYPGLTADLSCG